MRESHSSPNLVPSHRSSSIRLRKRRDEVKQQFVKNRRSGDFGYRLGTNIDAVDNLDNTDDVLTNSKDDTLDPRPAAGGIQHNLRPLLRNKYKIKHFGMIDQPGQEEDKSYTYNKR